jgi:long-chain acyl-CoA synthetase
MTTKPWMTHWPVDVPQTLKYPKVPLYELVKESAEAFPKNTAYVFEDESTSYEQYYTQIEKFAAALHSLGVKFTDKVALYLPNIPSYLISYFAVNRIGAIVVPCNAAYREKEIGFILKDSEAETIVVLEDMLSILKNLREETALKNVIVVGKETLPNTLNFYELLSKTEPDPPVVEIKSEDIAVLGYTGGTTGIPKGALLTNLNLVSNAMTFTNWFYFEKGSESTIAILPLTHIFGMTCAMTGPLSSAATVFLMPKFNPGKVLELISTYKISYLPCVPTAFIALLHYPELEKFDLGSLRFALSGGSSLPVQVMREFADKTGVNLLEGYGLTEAAPVTHLSPIARKKGGSIGIPIIDIIARIVDDNGNELPIGERGELAIRGPNVMKGYWKKPDETKNTLIDGELRTGDIATMDEEGYFFIVDRKKDMINVSGYNVYPRDVEEVLYEHPAVKTAAAIGIPDEYRGEVVKAYIVLKEGQNATEEEIIKFCKEKIAKFKVPKFVEFRESLPMTSVGKVLRKALKEEIKTT